MASCECVRFEFLSQSHASGKSTNKITTKAIRCSKQLRYKYQILSSNKYGLSQEHMIQQKKRKTTAKTSQIRIFCVFMHFVLCLCVFTFSSTAVYFQMHKKLHCQTYLFWPIVLVAFHCKLVCMQTNCHHSTDFDSIPSAFFFSACVK